MASCPLRWFALFPLLLSVHSLTLPQREKLRQHNTDRKSSISVIPVEDKKDKKSDKDRKKEEKERKKEEKAERNEMTRSRIGDSVH